MASDSVVTKPRDVAARLRAQTSSHAPRVDEIGYKNGLRVADKVLKKAVSENKRRVREYVRKEVLERAG